MSQERNIEYAAAIFLIVGSLMCLAVLVGAVLAIRAVIRERRQK